jgi:hypothetical protein
MTPERLAEIKKVLSVARMSLDVREFGDHWQCGENATLHGAVAAIRELVYEVERLRSFVQSVSGDVSDRVSPGLKAEAQRLLE